MYVVCMKWSKFTQTYLVMLVSFKLFSRLDIYIQKYILSLIINPFQITTYMDVIIVQLIKNSTHHRISSKLILSKILNTLYINSTEIINFFLV